VIEIVLAALAAPHLLLVDVAMAGPLVAAWLRWRAGRANDGATDALARSLALQSLWALAVGSLLGGALLAVRYLADDRAYFRALAAIPADRLWFAAVELLFSFLCLVAYLALWNRGGRRPLIHGLLALAGSSNLMIHFPALFAVIAVVSSRGELASASLDRAAYRRLLVDGEVLSRVAHVWIAAAAVTGIVLAILALRTPLTRMSQETQKRNVKSGARLALAATVLQFPAGAWLVLEMPEGAQNPLLGGDWLAAGLFLVSLLVSVQLLHLLAAMAWGDPDVKQVRRALVCMAIVVLFMASTRLRLNEATQVLDPTPAALLPAARAAAGAESAPRGLALPAASASMVTRLRLGHCEVGRWPWKL
jgi:hypothetical protein